jgi:hypothetical protein
MGQDTVAENKTRVAAESCLLGYAVAYFGGGVCPGHAVGYMNNLNYFADETHKVLNPPVSFEIGRWNPREVKPHITAALLQQWNPAPQSHAIIYCVSGSLLDVPKLQQPTAKYSEDDYVNLPTLPWKSAQEVDLLLKESGRKKHQPAVLANGGHRGAACESRAERLREEAEKAFETMHKCLNYQQSCTVGSPNHRKATVAYNAAKAMFNSVFEQMLKLGSFHVKVYDLGWAIFHHFLSNRVLKF